MTKDHKCLAPLVSIFIPYYNDENFLRKSIDSVLTNNYENFELILLNHACTDKSREIAHSYQDKRIIHIDMDSNYGAGGGILFEKMLNVASGKYIKPLCADDILLPNGLISLVSYMENNPEKSFAFGNIEYIDKDGIDLRDSWFNNRPFFSVHNDEIKCLQLYMQGISFLPYIGSIIKRSALKSVKINKTYIMMFDMSLWVSLLCKGYKIGYVNKLVCCYRISEFQVSSIENNSKACFLSYFENKTFYKLFFSISSIELAKKLFPKSPFLSKLCKEEDIPFFVAYNIFIARYMLDNAATFIDDLLNDKRAAKKLKNRFGYTVKEYRKNLMSFMTMESDSPKGTRFYEFKHKIYSTPSRALGLGYLSFLTARRIHAIVTFRSLREKHKRKYSL